jgi:hypothetical protein
VPPVHLKIYLDFSDKFLPSPSVKYSKIEMGTGILWKEGIIFQSGNLGLPRGLGEGNEGSSVIEEA